MVHQFHEMVKASILVEEEAVLLFFTNPASSFWHKACWHSGLLKIPLWFLSSTPYISSIAYRAEWRHCSVLCLCVMLPLDYLQKDMQVFQFFHHFLEHELSVNTIQAHVNVKATTKVPAWNLLKEVTASQKSLPIPQDSCNWKYHIWIWQMPVLPKFSLKFWVDLLHGFALFLMSCLPIFYLLFSITVPEKVHHLC